MSDYSIPTSENRRQFDVDTFLRQIAANPDMGTPDDGMFQNPPVGPIWDMAAAEENWLVWEAFEGEDKHGNPKIVKVPVKVRMSKKTDKVTGRGKIAAKIAACHTLDDALRYARALNAKYQTQPHKIIDDNGGFGVGYLARKGSAMVTIDADSCLAPDGSLTGRVGMFMAGVRTKTYCEPSVSGKGVRGLIARSGDEPFLSDAKSADGDGLGLYTTDARFAVITGNGFEGYWQAVEDQPGLVDQLVAEHDRITGDTPEARAEARAERDARLAAKNAKIDGIWRDHWMGKLPSDQLKRAVAAMLKALPKKFVVEYQLWLSTMFAMKDITHRAGWSEIDGFTIFDKWSQTGGNYNYTRNWDKWAKADDDSDDPITFGSLLHYAKEGNFDRTPYMHDTSKFTDGWEDIDFGPMPAPDGDVDQCQVDDEPGEDIGLPEEIEPDPIDLTRPPGLLGQMVDIGEARSNRAQRFFALAGALVALSSISGHRWVVRSPLFTTGLNLMVLAAGPSGAGKEDARDQVTGAAAINSTLPFMVSGAPASDAGLHAQLLRNPRQTVMIDEFGRYLKAMGQPGTSHDYKMITLMMQVFPNPMKPLQPRIYSDRGKDKAAVPMPYLCGLFTTTPSSLLSSLDSAFVTDGVLGRMLMLSQETVPPLAMDLPDEMIIQQQDVDAKLERIAKFKPSVAEGLDDPGVEQVKGVYFSVIRMTPEAEALLWRTVRPKFDEWRGGANEVIAPLWNRAFELVLRIAGIVALGCADDLRNVTIDEDVARYAAGLVEYSVRLVTPDISAHAHDGEYDGIRKSLLQAVQKHAHGPKGKHPGHAKIRDVLQASKGGNRPYQQVRSELDALCSTEDFAAIQLATHKDEEGNVVISSPKRGRITQTGMQMLGVDAAEAHEIWEANVGKRQGVKPLDITQFRPKAQ